MSYDDLRDRLDTEGLLPSRETLSAAVVRRLACDAAIIPAILGTQGQASTSPHQPPGHPGIWTALVLRDQHCAFPLTGPLACDAHHIQTGPTAEFPRAT